MNPSIRLLIVSGDTADLASVGAHLAAAPRGTVAVREAQSLAAARAELERPGSLDVVLLDLSLSDATGTKAMDAIRRAAPNLPVIVWTDLERLDVATKCLERGAVCYLIKGRMEKALADVLRQVAWRSAAERGARDAETDLRVTLEAMHDPLLVISESGVVIFTNRAATRLFGARLAEGTSFGLVVDELSAQELEVSQPDGSVAVVEMRSTSAHWSGSLARIVSFRDITAHKSAEASLQRVNQRLAREQKATLNLLEDQRRAQKARQASELQHRLLFDSSQDALLVRAAHERCFTTCNPAAVAMFRAKDTAELIAKSPRDLAPELQPDGTPSAVRLQEAAETALRTGRHFYEWSARRLDGEVFPATVQLARVQIGETTLLQSTVRDITEQRRADEDRTRLVTAMEQTADCMMIVDLNGKIVYANPTFEKVTGHAREDVIGRNPRLLKSGLHGREFYGVLWSTILSGRVWSGELTNRRRDGVLFVAETTIAPIRDSAGRVTSFLSTSTDITARKEAERRLREQAELLNKTREMIVVCDRLGRITFWNQSAERLLGWSAGEVMGWPVQRIFVRGDNLMQVEVQEAFTAWKDWQGETPVLDSRRNELTLETSVTALRAEDGEPAGRIIVCADITDKKRLQEQFFRVQRLDSLGSLASGLSHDLNNVLAPIGIGAALLRRKVPDENSRKILARIESSVKRGADIIRQVLTFARGEDSQRTPLQVRLLLGEMVDIAQATFPPSIRVELEAPKDLWPVLGDATQLHQVLMNLAVNARDAMPNGGRLAMSARNLVMDAASAAMTAGAREGRYVRITVSDTGTGIPPELMARIFEPFFTTKEKGRGTGLGLSTVFGVAKSHGGYVTVKSEVGLGSSFDVFLPASSEEESGAAESDPVQLPRGQGQLVLVADDEVAVREVIIATLKENGYEAVEASDGVEATGAFVADATKFAAVITDMMMPNMDGATLARTLLRIRPGIPIIGMTGNASDQGRKTALGAGFSTILSKPFSREALLNELHAVLQTHGGAGAQSH